MFELRVLQEIKNRYDSLTEAQRRTADFVVEHLEDVAFMGVEEVAAAVGVSTATVVRFAVELGYSGYAELNEELRHFLKRQLGPLRGVADPLTVTSPATAFDGAIQQDLEALSMLAARGDRSALPAVVERVLSAQRVWVVGSRSLYTPAVFLAWGLQLVRSRVRLLPESEARLPEQLVDMEPADVLIAFSFARYYRSTVAVARLAASQGVPIVAITDTPLSPVARLTDLVLTAPYKRQGFPGFSVVAALSVANGLLAAVAADLSPEQKQHMVSRIERAEEIQAAWEFWRLDPVDPRR